MYLRLLTNKTVKVFLGRRIKVVLFVFGNLSRSEKNRLHLRSIFKTFDGRDP